MQDSNLNIYVGDSAEPIPSMKKNDNKNIYLKHEARILFVCYGNVCRSPMAEGLAKHILGKRAQVESAAFEPVFDRAVDNAIKVMKDLYDIDISAHQPRHLLSVSRDDFDYVIVLDSEVYRALQ